MAFRRESGEAVHCQYSRVRGAEQARSHTVPSPAGGDPAPRRPPLFWCAGVACACGTMRASVCATAEVLVARQHAVSEPTSLTCGRGRGGRSTRLGGMERQRALVVLALRRRVARRVGVRSGGKSSGRRITPAGDPGVDWGVLCARRGVVGDVPGLWRGRRHARITQGRHVGELEPELYFLGVGG